MTGVLVLLATHNGEPWLAEQLDSILGQKGVAPSILVGDDCSNDGTVELLRNRNDGRVEVLEFEKPAGNAGQSFLRLLRHADIDGFDYVAFSDQDDLWKSDKLSRAVARLQMADAVAYSAAVTAFWPDGREATLSQSPRATDLDFLFEGAGQGCTFVLRVDFAQRLRRFVMENADRLTGIHYHDWLTYALSRAWRTGWIFDREPCMRYRQHSGNDTGARAAMAGVRKRLSLIRNGWYGKQVHQIVDAVSTVGRDALPEDFREVWTMPRGLKRRVLLAMIVLRHGRRRISDRAVLAASSIAGWI